MGDMGFALQLTVIALGALVLISLLFVGLGRGLQWLASFRSKDKDHEVAMTGERKKALTAAAVTSYLEAEQEVENEEKV